jgi:hypothetical protein
MNFKDSAARKPQIIETPRGGIHLVHSRNWAKPSRKVEAMVEPAESRSIASVALGSAAAIGPAIWIGLALLKWMHLL